MLWEASEAAAKKKHPKLQSTKETEMFREEEGKDLRCEWLKMFQISTKHDAHQWDYLW